MSLHKRSNTGPELAKAPVIVLCGGGSGGHITPLLAVADELKKLRPEAKLIFIGQKAEKLQEAIVKHSAISQAYEVRTGKFRRYHGEGIKQIFDIKTFGKNLRDFFYVLVGIGQSYQLLKRLKPDIVFIKGSFVGVPVGLAAAMLRVPFVTHDSDAVPGLANRIIGRWAVAHAVALPKEVYSYPASKTYTVGVPISTKFQPVDKKRQNDFKKQLKLKTSDQVIFVTGGGNGAQRLNQAVVKAAGVLLPANPHLVIIHATGLAELDSTNQLYAQELNKKAVQRVRTTGFFVDDLYINSGAADIVITRAGATNIAEFAAQHKACIIVPNPMLTAGHQLKNADYLAEQMAAVVISDKALVAQPELLVFAVQDLLAKPRFRQELGSHLGKFAKPRAAKELAELLLDTVT